MKQDMSNKLKVIRHEQEYAQKLFFELESQKTEHDENKIVFCALRPDQLKGEFELVGTTLVPGAASFPQDMLNISTPQSTGKTFFIENNQVLINGNFNPKYSCIFMDYGVDNKEIIFHEFEDPSVTIEIHSLDDPCMGGGLFNNIVIDPFLPGSFDIKSIEILERGMEESTVIGEIKDAGKMKIILDRRYSFHQIKFSFRINYEAWGPEQIKVFPFGIKKIGFYLTDFLPEPYIIFPIESHKTFRTISDEIFIETLHEKKFTTIANEGIELYLDRQDNHLSYPISTSSLHIENVIARNANKIYIKMPLNQTDSLLSMRFQKITYK